MTKSNPTTISNNLDQKIDSTNPTTAAATSTTTTNNLNPSKLNPALNYSRLTKFFSKFTNSNLHSKRKSSLPNLSHHHHQLPPNHNSNIHHNHHPSQIITSKSNHLNQSYNNSLSIYQNLNHHHHHSNPDDDDEADPNASIRPITPSSKAISLNSPINPIIGLTNSSLVDQLDPYSPADSKQFETPPITSSISISSSEPEPDDARSFFGNSSLASTKPTTVISLDNNPANRIAQFPPPPPHHHHHHTNHPSNQNHSNRDSPMAQPALSPRNRIITHHPTSNSPNHNRLQSGSSIALQPNTPSLAIFNSSPPSSHHQFSIINVPKHSLPHPSQNPHPAILSDNASLLTLASSGFAPSLHPTQNFVIDEDASVRALAPSRRESAESLSSRWSNVWLNQTGSIRTANTGFFLGINGSSCGTGLASGTMSPGGNSEEGLIANKENVVTDDDQVQVKNPDLKGKTKQTQDQEIETNLNNYTPLNDHNVEQAQETNSSTLNQPHHHDKQLNDLFKIETEVQVN
ncbi:hypothetical protein O181_038865 [Austropuccinia psidii MF-1]|uniref:Uncharacterized protein n=1 Tax=Austropuccinia psidii MF-1 TaxID=1389203 RepID=A0A9Q3HEK0_9BASI|nr:hypothetical protein [Austropuccinia psidii MF-1]